MLTHKHRKDLKIEARFLPDDLDQALEFRALIAQAIADGLIEDIAPSRAESVADSLTGWLIGKKNGVDGLAATTRSRYRRILAALEDQAPNGGGERGSAEVGIAGVLGLIGAGAAAGAASGNATAMALSALAPIIYEDEQVDQPFGGYVGLAAA